MRKYENSDTRKWWQEINRKLNTANPLRRTSLHGRPKMCVHKILTNSDMPFNPPPPLLSPISSRPGQPPFLVGFFVAWVEVTCVCNAKYGRKSRIWGLFPVLSSQEQAREREERLESRSMSNWGLFLWPYLTSILLYRNVSVIYLLFLSSLPLSLQSPLAAF